MEDGGAEPPKRSGPRAAAAPPTPGALGGEGARERPRAEGPESGPSARGTRAQLLRPGVGRGQAGPGARPAGGGESPAIFQSSRPGPPSPCGSGGRHRHGAVVGPQALPAGQAAAAGGTGGALHRPAHAGGFPHPRVSSRPGREEGGGAGREAERERVRGEPREVGPGGTKGRAVLAERCGARGTAVFLRGLGSRLTPSGMGSCSSGRFRRSVYD